MSVLERRPELVDIPAVWGEELAITIRMTQLGVAAEGVTACTVTMTDATGQTVKSTATTEEVSTGVWSAVWTATQMRTDVGPGRWPWVVTPTVDGAPQSIVAGEVQIARPSVSGIVRRS